MQIYIDVLITDWTCVWFLHAILMIHIFSQTEGIQTCTVSLLWKISDKACSKEPHTRRSCRTGCRCVLQDTSAKWFWGHSFCYNGGKCTKINKNYIPLSLPLLGLEDKGNWESN